MFLSKTEIVSGDWWVKQIVSDIGIIGNKLELYLSYKILLPLILYKVKKKTSHFLRKIVDIFLVY